MIKEILITVLTSSGIIGIATKFLIDRLKAYESRQKALELGVQALLRDRLYHIYAKGKTARLCHIQHERKFRECLCTVSQFRGEWCHGQSES